MLDNMLVRHNLHDIIYPLYLTIKTKIDSEIETLAGRRGLKVNLYWRQNCNESVELVAQTRNNKFQLDSHNSAKLTYDPMTEDENQASRMNKYNLLTPALRNKTNP